MGGRVVFHVGWPKTGSTSLQKNLFAPSRALVDLSEDPREAGEPFAVRLRGQRPGDADAAARLWHERLAPRRDGRTAVVSSEDLVTACDDPAALFRRIAALAPEAEILAVVRDQVQLIRSRYDMYPSPDPASGRAVPVPDYLDWTFGPAAAWADRLKFAAALAPAVATFGRERIHVFAFDRLFGAGRPDAGRLAALLDVPADAVAAALDAPRKNTFALYAARRRVRRLLGPIHASWFLPRAAVRAAKIRLARSGRFRRTEFDAAAVARITAYYAADNALFRAAFPEAAAL